MATTDERRPLLPSDHYHNDYADHRQEHRQDDDLQQNLHHQPPTRWTAAVRRQTKRYLTSKAGHYSVLGLVSLDISAIFAELILQILACEGRVGAEDAKAALEALGILGLVFSCLFMVELLASVWSFGWRFFQSWFHCVDATVIVAALIIDILLRGFPLLEEIGSLVVVLRLWRVFKIIEELSAGAAEQMEPFRERIEELEKNNGLLQQEIEELRAGLPA